jgi:hypothetical protein
MRWWSAVAAFAGRHKILADVAIGIVFGLIVEFVAVPLFFSDTRLLRDLGDGLVDDAIRIHERLTGTVEHATPYVFVDIDDETWRDWGYPLVAPREKLAGLIDRVMASKPLAVLLDVDLAWPDTSGQSALAEVLKRDNASGPPLFMVRGLVSRAPHDPDQWPRLQVTPFTAAVQAPPSVGEGVSTATRPGYRWVSPLFERDADGVVRYARLFDFVCDGEAPAALPAAQLMLAAQAIDARNDRPEVAEAVTSALAQLIPDRCGAAAHAAPAARVSEHPEIELSLKESSIRVIYTIAWREGATSLGPTAIENGSSRPLVAVRPARIVLAAPAGEAIDGLEGRLVVIGGSFRDSGDWHNTPLGAMPGALLVVNAAHALAQYGTPHEPPWWQRLPIALGIIIVLAWLFAVLRPFGASIAASVFLILLTIPSALLFKSGVMLDLAVPSFGVFAHKFLLEIIERVELVRSKGFRALLADHGEGK